MSFSATKKRALDASRHINARRVAVRSCIQLCLFYSGFNGYQAIVDYYTRHNRLNDDALTAVDIETILADLTALRERSKQLWRDYAAYRRERKRSGYGAMSNHERAVHQQYLDRIAAQWDKFDTAENRERKRAEREAWIQWIADYYNLREKPD